MKLVENNMHKHTFTHLDALESESIHIMREVAAECKNPALLFSGGKDSIVMLRLAEKAFRPAKFPFPLVHIDTEHNFPEVIACPRQAGCRSGRAARSCVRWKIPSSAAASSSRTRASRAIRTSR